MYHSLSPIFKWMETAPALLEESEEDLITWLSRAPPITELNKFVESQRTKLKSKIQ